MYLFYVLLKIDLDVLKTISLFKKYFLSSNDIFMAILPEQNVIKILEWYFYAYIPP